MFCFEIFISKLIVLTWTFISNNVIVCSLRVCLLWRSDCLFEPITKLRTCFNLSIILISPIDLWSYLWSLTIPWLLVRCLIIIILNFWIWLFFFILRFLINLTHFNFKYFARNLHCFLRHLYLLLNILFKFLIILSRKMIFCWRSLILHQYWLSIL